METSPIRDNTGFEPLEGVSLGKGPTETSDKPTNDTGSWNWLGKFGDNMFQGFLENPAKTLLFLGLIGYIIIAALGHLENFGTFLQYIFFLVGLGLAYSFIEGKIKIKIKSKHYIILGIIIFVIIYILIFVSIFIIIFNLTN